MLAAVAIAGCNHSSRDNTTGTTGRGIEVEEIDIGRSLNADKSIGDNTTSFKPTDTIYLSIKTEGSAASAQLRTRWLFSDGQVVDESSQTIAPTGEARTEFHIAKPDGFPPGKYKAEVLLNGQPAGAKEFEVERP
ncbi:MAG TPA: hypothetical protein VH679_11590 [Vicinamibacterales bacterium]|jgi:hypothetical protein